MHLNAEEYKNTRSADYPTFPLAIITRSYIVAEDCLAIRHHPRPSALDFFSRHIAKRGTITDRLLRRKIHKK